MNVLFLNHKQEQCGVYQFGDRLARVIQKSEKFATRYAEIDSIEEFEFLLSLDKYDVVIYNWYPSTMGWAHPAHADRFRGQFVQVGIFHEVPNEHFDYYIHADPTLEDDGKTFSTGRPLLEYDGFYPTNMGVPIIGSFGFGMGGKGYPDIIKLVEQEYDEAVVKLHISHAYFGDETGEGARHWVNLVRQEMTKPNVKLEVTHNFLNNQQLLFWLASNTVNVFLYEEMYGRGIGSTVDYALSVRRPIALTKSYMFRHLWDAEPSIFVEDLSLKEIIGNGTAPLRRYYQEWSQENLVRRYEYILEQITS